jgi:hypothetical protein
MAFGELHMRGCGRRAFLQRNHGHRVQYRREDAASLQYQAVARPCRRSSTCVLVEYHITGCAGFVA